MKLRSALAGVLVGTLIAIPVVVAASAMPVTSSREHLHQRRQSRTGPCGF
jgi:hypothetical protein